MNTEFYTNVKLNFNKILLMGYDKHGHRIKKKVHVNPYLFEPDPYGDYKTIHGDPVSKKTFERITDARNYLNESKEIVNRKVYGFDRWQYAWINDTYPTINPEMNRIRIASLDIEVISHDGSFPDASRAEYEVTSITVYYRNKYYVFAYHDYKAADNVVYEKCKNEVELFRKFIVFWQRIDIDVVTGWNVELFDFAYLINRMQRLFDDESYMKLSPWNKVEGREVKLGHNTEISWDLAGITILDYLQVYKKFNLNPRESYKLDYIGEVELGVKKLDYSEHGSLHNLYKNDFQKFIDYNIRDTELIFLLEEKLGYLMQVFTIAYDAKVNFADTLGSVLIWDVIVHNHLMESNTVVNLKKAVTKRSSYAGGFVKQSLVGMHEWVASFDLNSLYPHLIQQYNIGPDTKLPPIETDIGHVTVDNLLSREVDTSDLHDQNITMTPNRVFYSKEKQSFFSEIMERMYNDRTKYKNELKKAKNAYEVDPSVENANAIARFHNLQLAKKIQLNSAYGAMGNVAFRWFDIDNAEGITLAGQLSIRFIEGKINEYMNKILNSDKDYVVAVDTDSTYVCLDDLIKQVFDDTSDTDKVINFMDKICDTKLQDMIDNSYQDLADYVNAYDQKMVMKREVLASKGIFTGKKRYILNVWDNEGFRYKEPELKMMGIEAIRSSTPSACRDYIKKSLNIIINENEEAIQSYIKEIRDEFKKQDIDAVCFNRGVNFAEYLKPDWSYTKGTPIAVRAAALHNKYVVDHGLTKEVELVKDGDKIKFSYMKMPNPVGENVMANVSSLPALLDYVDYDEQFEKGYLKPIDIILTSMGWSHKKISTLERFFV